MNKEFSSTPSVHEIIDQIEQRLSKYPIPTMSLGDYLPSTEEIHALKAKIFKSLVNSKSLEPTIPFDRLPSVKSLATFHQENPERQEMVQSNKHFKNKSSEKPKSSIKQPSTTKIEKPKPHTNLRDTTKAKTLSNLPKSPTVPNKDLGHKRNAKTKESKTSII